MLARFMTIILGTLIAAGPVSFTAQADPQHGIAMHGQPKYPADFDHIDYANPDAPKGGTLVMGAQGTFDSLNPFLIRGVPAQGLNLVFEGLMARSRDEPFTLYGLLAESIEVPEDRSWVTFTLHPDTRFQDGTPVTIDDVIFSLETLRDHGRPNHFTYYSRVKKIERIGDRGVKFTFDEEGDRELPLILGLMRILPKHHFETREFDAISLDPIPGSGPYVVDSVDPGRGIRYRRDPNYWGKDLPINRGHYNFDEVRFDYFRDDLIALEAFTVGALDARVEQGPQNWITAYQDEDLIKEEIRHDRPSGLRGMVFNTRQDLFSDIRVRRALIHTFDFEWLNKKLFFGAFTRTQSYFDNSELAAPLSISKEELALFDELPIDYDVPPAFLEPLDPLPISDGAGNNRDNLALSATLLGEAGWRQDGGTLQNRDGTPFVFEIMLINAADLRIAQQFSRDLKRLGIEARVRLVDDAQYQSRLSTYDFDMIIYDWGQSLSPGNEQAFYWGSAGRTQPGTRNYMGADDPAIDLVIAQLTAARTRKDLVTATRLLDRILRAGHYVIPLFHLNSEWVVYRRPVSRPEISPAMGILFDTWWAENNPSQKEAD